MKKRFTLNVIAMFVFAMTTALVAQAQANRTFVSGNSGTDIGNCPKTAPCKTLNYAQTVTNTAGEIVVTDSDGVGQVTITKALTIEAEPGEYAFIKAQPGTAGITVSPGAGVPVILRNIQIGGQGGASSIGIQHSSGKLVVENCTFQQLTTGINVASSNGAVIANSFFSANTNGLVATAGKVDVRKSIFSYNTGRAIYALVGGQINLQETQVSNNATGVTADGFGGCLSTNPVQQPLVVVRIELGAVTNNTLGFEMLNQGAACPNASASHGQNILVRNDGGTASAVTPNITGNATFLSVQGVASAANVSLGQYQSITNGFQP